MTLPELLDRLASRPRPAAVAACGFAVLAGMHIVAAGLTNQAAGDRAARESLAELAEESAQALTEAAAQRDLRLGELQAFKVGLPELTQSRRALYEGGLQLQEEKRLLEKQLEIMTTYLLIDEEARKIHVMRGEQSLESYSVQDAPPAVYGREFKDQPAVAAIVSKERFAHPERPKAEQVNGQFQWEPPQVGSSVRANALGEFVVFTRGPLILHGPPTKPEEHAAFPHHCLGLTLTVARRLYANTYIGTKVMVKPPTLSR